jgi:hypothetical protein
MITSEQPETKAQPASVRVASPTPKASGGSAGEVVIEQRKVVCSGRWLRMARIFDEHWIGLPPIRNPEAFVISMQDHGVKADIFTFAQQLPNTVPQFEAEFMEWDNVAVAPSSDFKAWWDALPQESRKNVRRSQKRGVSVRPVDFDDDLVRGIKSLYDETPFRQGRRFWHYGKDLATVKRENASYLDRSQFIGAFLNGELIGFIKMVFVGTTARIMQILSRNEHFDKFPANALIAAAMEACAKRPVDHFIYGQYIYGNKHNSSITEFKRRNGFKPVLLPRYHLPITARGRAALALGLHRGVSAMLPEPAITFLLDTRSFVYERLLPRARGT